MHSKFKIITVLILSIFLTSLLFAQHQPSKERGDAKYRAKGQMEGNNIRATIFNHGHSGRYGGEYPLEEQTPYEWPKNTGKVYLALTAIFVGAEVYDEAGDRQRIIDVSNYRSSNEGKSWNFEPIPGYYNNSLAEQEIANSEKPETWPDSWPDKQQDELDPGWPGSWNGYFGKNIFNADMEMFYRASDDNYDRYSYYFPDSTDRTRKGLGIILEVRIMTWTQVLVQDAMYHIHNIINDGTKDIEKVAVTVWFADFVGGDGDSQDDISEFDLQEDILWARDSDHKATTFGDDPVGIVAVSLLETPGNAIDRIDNDGDGELNGPKVTEDLLVGEIADNLTDDNGNGLIDENQTHIPFDIQVGVTYADRIDQNGDAEANSPVITSDMISQSAGDQWHLWPPGSESEAIHLIMVEDDDEGSAFKDFIDNDDNSEEGSPTITQEIINQAANDAPYYRYQVPGTSIILYDVKSEDLGKQYADGIDNDGDGAIDEDIDEGIDEMVDEARDDGIDNDGDWIVSRDDVGLDGVANTGDFGEGDGVPTSGAGTGLPGEPNVDLTDVSETDQIGITSASKVTASGIQSDAEMWLNYMVPGDFYEPNEQQGEYDLFVSSGYFPLKSGQQEPFSIAVMLANGPIPDPGGVTRKREILRKRVRAQETYNNDYQFAQAPLTPTLSAVAGDNKVTLYWDDVAESSFDTYIDGIGGNGNDFEGYRIYRSTDPAFEDVENITNGYGTPLFKTPLKIFDIENGLYGFHPVDLDGIHYRLSDDIDKESGIQHTFVDTTVQNGFTYYYTVVSFDQGYEIGEIIPSESPYSITVYSDGTVAKSKNVAVVTPEAPPAGYIPASLGEVEQIEGFTSSNIGYTVRDPFEIQDGHTYHITFTDTLLPKTTLIGYDTLTTKDFSVYDATDGQYVIQNRRAVATEDEQPVIEGFQLFLYNNSTVTLIDSLSGWNDTSMVDFIFEKVTTSKTFGGKRPNDYTIIFDDNVGFGRSTEFVIDGSTIPAKDVNFKIYNERLEEYIDFGFLELDQTDGEGKLSLNGAFRDRIIFLEPGSSGENVITWWFYLPSGVDTDPNYRIPVGGDTVKLVLTKPFLSTDKFELVASTHEIDKEQAKIDLNKIKVVPNPYVATAAWEPKNLYTTGRGARELHFTHLPSKCTIRIFTVNGELVDTIEHEALLNDGTAEWDLLTRDNLQVSYGIYIYHIDAPGIGEKIGKFAVIK
ncbi:MAG: hypothetical protein PVH88_07905 [Ignavibacteria bacterium]|jgi:hypothetical protein